ncbi:MAG: hypothetical protein ABL957_13180 [Parvularculaceae bacterium]
MTKDAALASRLGVTGQSIRNWRERKNATERQICELVHKASRAGAHNLQASALRPIVEFFPIDAAESKQGRKLELFSIKTDDGSDHQYLAGLRAELGEHSGVYLFFDSRGRAIYAGKARSQKLWKEMNLAFNRNRGTVQSIRRVSHPERNQVYKTSKEKARQIVDRVVPLNELAEYFSAYEVADVMINDIETMLVRSFANDLLNKRMERFGQQKSKRRPNTKNTKRAKR